MVLHKGSTLYTTQKTHKKTNGKNTGGREALKSKGKGNRKKPSRGRQESSGTRGSHPGRESWSVSGGEGHIPQSLGTKRNQEGWPSWVEYRPGGTKDHPGVDIKYRVPSSVSDWYIGDWVDLREIHNVRTRETIEEQYILYSAFKFRVLLYFSCLWT